MKPKMLLIMLIALLATVAFGQAHRVLPEGTEIKVRTDTAIPAKPAANTKYTATVSNDVTDNSGALAIPKGAVIRTIFKDVPPDGVGTGAALIHEHLTAGGNVEVGKLDHTRKVAADPRRLCESVRGQLHEVVRHQRSSTRHLDRGVLVAVD